MTFTEHQIKEISEQLDFGFRVFYHKKKGDLIFVPNLDMHSEMDTEAWEDEFATLKKHGRDYNEIEAMESSDSFQVMTDFAEQLTDPNLRDKLTSALSKKKPFREFKFVIDNSGEQREQWFQYKNRRCIEWTMEQIRIQKDRDEYKNAIR